MLEGVHDDGAVGLHAGLTVHALAAAVAVGGPARGLGGEIRRPVVEILLPPATGKPAGGQGAWTQVVGARRHPAAAVAAVGDVAQGAAIVEVLLIVIERGIGAAARGVGAPAHQALPAPPVAVVPLPAVAGAAPHV